jgi:hypothetical protein
LLLAAAPAPAQTGRQALTTGTERYLLADYRGALPLLSRGLDPKAGPPNQLWKQGVERLADMLLVLRQDSLAATWLRWAIRLAPDFEVDPELVPPAVVRAAAAARAFVDATPVDRFVARTAFEWPIAISAQAPGIVRLAPAPIPITARVGADQFLRGGESRRLSSASYDVVVSAPGYLPTRLTVEVLPGVTTVVAVALLPETAGLLYVAARPWGTLFVDGQRVGYTSVAAHRVVPGRHVLRLAHERGAAKDTTIVVGERQAVRLSWVGQPGTTGDSQLDRAFAALDRGDPERGAVLLRQWLSANAAGAPQGTQSLALARLGEVAWSLGLRDSARAYLRDLVQSDPFFLVPPDLFNPELEAVHVGVRRETPAIAIQAPRDTVVTPVRDSFPIRIAVGRPGEVRLLLRLTRPRPRDSLLVTLHVEGVAVARIPLTAPDGSALAPGRYAIEAEVAGSGPSALVELTVERLPVDTVPHQAPIPVFRPETRKGSPSLRTVGEGIGLGTLALLVSAAVNDAGVSGRAIPREAWVVGGSVTLANIALKRPGVPIAENIAYNQALARQRTDEDRAIAAANATRLGIAPLRIRTMREP